MAVSRALEKSARDFNMKYECDFDFATFEARVEEFTFLRPNNGWVEVYKLMFDRVYKETLEKAAVGAVKNLDGEAMLDDFEYTLIRPFVNESEIEIKHKHYVGMDRLSRLEYLDRLTKESPKNSVELYAEKYKRGELTLRQMRSAAHESTDREQYVELAGYVQALEDVNKNRSVMWRALHPFKNSAEKRDAAFMKQMIVDGAGGDALYGEIAAEAYETFDGHLRANENLAARTVHAKEEMNRLQKMSDVMRESLRIDCFDKELQTEKSQRVEQYKAPMRERQV